MRHSLRMAQGVARTGGPPVPTLEMPFAFAGWSARGHTGPEPTFPMNLKLFLRTVVFLAILFVMLYVGMNNLQSIKFSFPLAWDKAVEQPAALIYFGIFAVGVLAGVVLGAGGGKKDNGGKGR